MSSKDSGNKAYDTAVKTRDEDGECLRDYAENITWSDSLSALLGRETAEERRHRSGRTSIAGFSNETAAKLILMRQAQHAAEFVEIPRATAFLVFRKTAVEAQVIGFLARNFLSQDWIAEVKSLDYAKLMEKGYPEA